MVGVNPLNPPPRQRPHCRQNTTARSPWQWYHWLFLQPGGPQLIVKPLFIDLAYYLYYFTTIYRSSLLFVLYLVVFQKCIINTSYRPTLHLADFEKTLIRKWVYKLQTIQFNPTVVEPRAPHMGGMGGCPISSSFQ